MATKLYAKPPQHSMVPSSIASDIPVYRLRDDIFTGDTLFLKGSTLETDDDFEPNLAMFPLNELALKKYRQFLKEFDEKGYEFSQKEKKAYVAKLPAFEHEWEKVNNYSRTKRIHLVHAIDMAPAILGAPSGRARVRSVDMSSIPNIPHEDDTAVGKGNTQDKEMSSVSAVRSSIG